MPKEWRTNRRLKLYHGSNVVIDKIDLCLSRKGKDFGCGFYLNPNESQAREMAVRTAQRLQEGTPVVNAYLFDDSLLMKDSTVLYADTIRYNCLIVN